MYASCIMAQKEIKDKTEVVMIIHQLLETSMSGIQLLTCIDGCSAMYLEVDCSVRHCHRLLLCL